MEHEFSSLGFFPRAFLYDPFVCDLRNAAAAAAAAAACNYIGAKLIAPIEPSTRESVCLYV